MLPLRTLSVTHASRRLSPLATVGYARRVGVKVSVDANDTVDLTAADVRAGKMDGALPIVDVDHDVDHNVDHDVDHDGVFDLFDLGEPGKAVLYRGTRERGRSDDDFTFDAVAAPKGTLTEANRWVVPRFTQAVPLPSSSSVALVTAPSKGKSRLVLLGR